MEYDITFDYKSQQNMVLLDIGDDAIRISRDLLESMLQDLNEADERDE
jgi:hypothetical protein